MYEIVIREIFENVDGKNVVHERTFPFPDLAKVVVHGFFGSEHKIERISHNPCDFHIKED